MVVLAVVIVASAPEVAVEDKGLVVLAAVDAADDVCGMVGAGVGGSVGVGAVVVSIAGAVVVVGTAVVASAVVPAAGASVAAGFDCVWQSSTCSMHFWHNSLSSRPSLSQHNTAHMPSA